MRGKPALARGTSARRADGERARKAGSGADRGAGGERRRAGLRGMLSAAAFGSAPERLYIFLHALQYTTSLGVFKTEIPEWAGEGREWNVLLEDVLYLSIILVAF